MVVFGFFVSVICYMLVWRQMIVFRVSLLMVFVRVRDGVVDQSLLDELSYVVLCMLVLDWL